MPYTSLPLSKNSLEEIPVPEPISATISLLVNPIVVFKNSIIYYLAI
jgi:hypothetical protein